VINEGERVKFSSSFFRRRKEFSFFYNELKEIEKRLDELHSLLKEEEDYKRAKENIRSLKEDLKKVVKSKGFEIRIKNYQEQIEELKKLYVEELVEKDAKLRMGLIPTEYLLRALYVVSNALPNSSLKFPIDDLEAYISVKEYQSLINQLKQQIYSLNNSHMYTISLIKNGNRLKIKLESNYKRETSFNSNYFETVKDFLIKELEKMVKLIRFSGPK
jgi:septal ring factor EnvC (AmiA/AmiB activator)